MKPIVFNLKKQYLKGDVLDTKDTGQLFFHNDPLDPFYHSDCWVEAKLIEGTISQNNKCGNYEKNSRKWKS